MNTKRVLFKSIFTMLYIKSCIHSYIFCKLKQDKLDACYKNYSLLPIKCGGAYYDHAAIFFGYINMFLLLLYY